jgi:hypothetical protein
MRELLPPEGLSDFDGFVIAINHLIITSDNAGMFFGDKDTKIIGFRTLERLLRRSDGDVAFIQQMLATYDEKIDQTIRTSMVEFELAGQQVSYEVVSIGPLIDFPQLEWRNTPARQKIIDDFLAASGHPFDALTSSDEDETPPPPKDM